MKRIMFLIFLFLSLMVCITFSGCGGSFEDAGRAALERGDYDKAIRLFTEAIESGELSQEDLGIAYKNRGLTWLHKADNDKAIADFTKAIALNPKDAWAYKNRGYTWYNKGDDDKAIADFTKAIEIDPQDDAAWYNRARTYSISGEKDKALSDLKRGIALNESFKEKAKSDDDFKDLWNDKDFQKLTE